MLRVTPIRCRAFASDGFIQLLFSEKQRRFVPVVRAAPQFDIGLVVGSPRGKRTQMMKFQERTLLTSSFWSDEAAARLVTRPHFPPDAGRDVPRTSRAASAGGARSLHLSGLLPKEMIAKHVERTLAAPDSTGGVPSTDAGARLGHLHAAEVRPR